MIKLWLHRSQAGLYVAKALTKCYLGKSHAQVLIETGKRLRSIVAAISAGALVEMFFGKKVYQL
jgi:hypothetical protein